MSRSKVKGPGHHGQKKHFSALSAAFVWFMFGKTPLTSSIRFSFKLENEKCMK